jgi:dTMP kinase
VEAAESNELSHAPSHSLRAVLQIRDFHRLWVGQLFSGLGDWMGFLALTAMAATFFTSYSGQSYAIASVLLMRVLPALVLSPIAGYVADRVDRRQTMIYGDIARGLLFATIPLVGTLWWVMVVTILTESVSLIWGPAKDATVPNLVPAHRLMAANQIGLATSYGSALPGAIIFVILTGIGRAFPTVFAWTPRGAVDVAIYFDGLSYIISAVAIWGITSIPKGPAAAGDSNSNVLRVVVDGWKYVATTPLVRGLVFGVIGAFGAGGVVMGLARIFVSDLGGGDPAYGALFGAVFLGLALGMWGGPSFLRGIPRRRLFGLSLTLAGAMLIPLALIPSFVSAAFFAVAVGFFAGAAWITGNTMLGLEVPDVIRGRTLAFVASNIRMTLALVLVIGPSVAAVIGHVEFGPVSTSGRAMVSYDGAAVAMFLSGVVLTIVGLIAYRQMDDRKGISLWQDLKHSFSGWPGVYSSHGVFVALEGGEGAGKSTQAKLLHEWLTAQGYDVVLTREPGDTEIGKRLREMVLDPGTGSMSPRAEALIYAADKAEHVERVVAPALRRGAVVITDRYVDSTLAYQGAGRSLDRQVETVARWSTQDLRPHLTVLLDLAPHQGLDRFEGRDRIEAEGLEFHEKVRQRFLELAGSEPEHYLVLDAADPTAELAERIRARVQPLLGQATSRG